MKFLAYILRNARRNPVRSLLTVATLAVSLFMMVSLRSLLAANEASAAQVKGYHRIVVMSSQGFAQPVRIALRPQVEALDGVVAVTPFAWFGGKYADETIPFAQFGVDPQTVFTVYHELRVPEDQLEAFQAEKTAVAVGRKLADDRGWKVGDSLPLKGDVYPFDLDLTIRAIFDGPNASATSVCYFHWESLDEGLRRAGLGENAGGNAGTLFVACRDDATMPRVIKQVDDMTRNSDTPTRSQTEDAFVAMFSEMWGDLWWIISAVGAAVLVALVLVAGVSMAMSMRERTTEVAVLKAIGYGRGLVTFLVLAEAVVIAMIGGVLGALGGKALFDVWDVGPYTGGFLPYFTITWPSVILGLAGAALIGLASGILPAWRAANMSVVNGLRKVI